MSHRGAGFHPAPLAQPFWRSETCLDARNSEANRILQRSTAPPRIPRSGAVKSVETSLDAADTSVRATQASQGLLLTLALMGATRLGQPNQRTSEDRA
jgi:hypothetical protein